MQHLNTLLTKQKAVHHAVLPVPTPRVHAAKRSVKHSYKKTDDIDALRQKGIDQVEHKMFCYQCEQTLGGSGCTELGVCGKTPEVAALQDLLIYALKGLGALAHVARTHGIPDDQEVNSFLNGAIFSTLTNVNFDDERFKEMLHTVSNLESRVQGTLAAKGLADEFLIFAPSPRSLGWTSDLPHPTRWSDMNAFTMSDLVEQGRLAGIDARREKLGATLTGLQELIVYGLKGTMAYAHHAEALGYRDPRVYAFCQEALWFLCQPASKDVGKVLEYALRVGECNMIVMEMLSNAHSDTFGHPTPTSVNLNPVPGKCILITGHDMHDMELLLKATEGMGINVYTHGEMLPAHSYPGLHKYPHLKGHFGGAWYRQKVDFADFPGPVVVTTNCVLDPLSSYRDNVFTLNETGLSGVAHLGTKDFTKVIEKANQLPGFVEDRLPKRRVEAGRLDTVTVGFGHHTVLSVADQVIDAVKTGKLEHIFLVGGCDGNEPQRKYYGKLYEYMPKSTMVLTLGCGKFRIFDQDFGNLPGTDLPRLLDMGQCNDAYSAIVVASELAKAFNTDINSLPLSLDLSWFEQKAVAVLLTLLHLGVKNIRLGPRLPAFLTTEAVQVLVDKFNLMPADVENPEEDLKRMMEPVSA